MAKVKKSLRICDHDLKEIEMFRQYLEDKQSMPRDEFYRKYQEYMGLSDEELAYILLSAAAPTDQGDKP